MATRFVPCRNVEHAVECHVAGLLWINYSGVPDFPRWEPSSRDEYWTPEYVAFKYGLDYWPPEDFAILFED